MVRPLVGSCDKELIDEVSLGPHYFNSIIPGGLSELRRPSEICDRCFYGASTELLGLEGGDWRLQRGGGDVPGGVSVATCMEELKTNEPPMSVDLIGNDSMFPGLVSIAHLRSKWLKHARPVWADATRYDEPHSSSSARTKKGGQAFELPPFFLKAHMH